MPLSGISSAARGCGLRQDSGAKAVVHREFGCTRSQSWLTRSSSKWRTCRVHAVKETGNKESDPDSVTKQYGLEAGIFSAFKNGSGAASAKDLLKRYGSAYLLTSITLALISFSVCYLAVDAGVDVPSLLGRFGLAVDANSAWDKGGTVAIAYAAHKALSPVRFPPTVALTPIIAQRIGKRGDEDEAASDRSSSDVPSDKS